MRRGRSSTAGVTLVEMLVVLVLVGILASAVALSVGGARRGAGAEPQAQLLAARLQRAADEAVLTGRAVALIWTGNSYRFMELDGDRWAPHQVVALGREQKLDGGLAFLGAAVRGGSWVLDADLRPRDGRALTLPIGPAGSFVSDAVRVSFDGVSAFVGKGAT